MNPLSPICLLFFVIVVCSLGYGFYKKDFWVGIILISALVLVPYSFFYQA